MAHSLNPAKVLNNIYAMSVVNKKNRGKIFAAGFFYLLPAGNDAEAVIRTFPSSVHRFPL